MKKFTKILSLVLAVSLVASLFVVNVMAASAERTATLTTNATGDLKAGDKVTVSIKIDTTALISTLQYIFTYDKDAFEIDTTKGVTVGRATYENFLEPTWCTNVMSKEDNNWFYYFGKPTLTYAVDGEIYCSWTDSNGVAFIEESYAVNNDLIGNFILTVKEDAKAGEYTFGLKDAFAADNGEITKTPFVINTAKVTVEGDEPEVVVPSISTAEPTATEAGIAVERADGTKFTYDNCYTVTVSMTNANDATKAGMQFIPKKVYENADNTWTGYAEVEFAADGLGAGERAYTAALINIPRKLAGQNIDMMARGFMVVDGKTLTGTVVESVVNYKVTPEPGQN